MKYDGVEIKLEPEAEEVASFFAALIGTDWAANPVFCKNFFNDFLAVLKTCKKVLLYSFCSFCSLGRAILSNTSRNAILAQSPTTSIARKRSKRL
jgi:DNA topoisomerase-1